MTYDAESGFFIIFYRVRTPLEKGRGGSVVTAAFVVFGVVLAGMILIVVFR